MQSLLLRISNLPATLSHTIFSKYDTSTMLKVFRLSRLIEQTSVFKKC